MAAAQRGRSGCGRREVHTFLVGDRTPPSDRQGRGGLAAQGGEGLGPGKGRPRIAARFCRCRRGASAPRRTPQAIRAGRAHARRGDDRVPWRVGRCYHPGGDVSTGARRHSRPVLLSVGRPRRQAGTVRRGLRRWGGVNRLHLTKSASPLAGSARRRKACSRRGNDPHHPPAERGPTILDLDPVRLRHYGAATGSLSGAPSLCRYGEEVHVPSGRVGEAGERSPWTLPLWSASAGRR